MIVAKYIVLLFGFLIITMGLLMLLNPKRARVTLQKAGSTNFINYTEITLRLIPAVSLIIAAPVSKYPQFFEIFGWIMTITSLLLFCIPRRWHHAFSLKSAEILTPLYFRLISPFAIFGGGFIVWGIL
jgi:uncharacterized protein YjeT (DUF2065 family)